MPPRFATPEDDAYLRAVLTHPQVEPWVTCDGAPPFEPERYTAHSHSCAIIVEGGCWLLAALEQDAYGVHTCLTPECRGQHAIDAATAALELVFLCMDATQLWTSVPDNNPQALRFAHAMGFRDQYTRDRAWCVHGRRHAMTYLRLDIDDWAQASRRMGELGEQFHAQREGAGFGASHEPDQAHDRYVGVAMALIAVGQLAKAQHVYGRWARACGYAPFEFVSTDPVVLDIGDALVDVDGADYSFRSH